MSNESQDELPDLPTSQAIEKALALHQRGRLAEAEQIYTSILSAEPDQLDALHLLGALKHQQGQFTEALRLIARALQINPGSADAHSNYGLSLAALKRDVEAITSFDRALGVDPNHLDGLFNRGNSAVALARFKDAVASYDQVLSLKPDHIVALNNRGHALLKQGRFKDSLANFSRALALKPDYFDALANQGDAMQYLGRYAEASESYKAALAINPNDIATLCNRAVVLVCLKKHIEALESYDKALSIDSNSSQRWNNRANVLVALNRHAEAITDYEKALAIQPDNAEAHFNMSLSLLTLGDFPRGWKEYEWRWKIDRWAHLQRELLQPKWLGDRSLEGKTILLHSEQGLGDTIQFSRYVSALAEKGARVILEVQPPLKAVLSSITGLSGIVSLGEPLPKFDLHCPLISLPFALRTEISTIPVANLNVHVSDQHRRKWNRRLGKSKIRRVGLAWAGSRVHKNDANRSINLNYLLELADKRIQLVSLQKDVQDSDAAVLRKNARIVHVGEELDDFTDTAAVINSLDLIISADTSVAHLAGAMGKLTWILLPFWPDFRWMLDREDSPWYPTARLFRQSDLGDWDGVFRRVKRELALWLKASA
jgi:tetratricopeptide (TPR) repeat protein